MREPEFYRKKLDNGITVVFEKRDIPIVAVSSSVRFGAQFESEEIKGISHFIEHLVFKGTKNRNVSQISQEVESKGGIINAFTGEDITCYWNKLPSRHFELGMDIVRDLVLNPVFEKEALERERKVILEEIKMYHDNPASYVLEKIKEMLYERPFGLSIAGTIETVSQLSRERVVDLFNSIYSTNNMIVGIVGKAEFDDIVEEAKKFPTITRKINSLPVVEKSGEFVEKRDGIDQAHLAFGLHMPKLRDKNRYSAEVFDSILGGGMSSRLFQEVREKRGLCYAIKSSLEQSRDYSYMVIYVGTIKEKVEEVKEIVLKEIRKIEDLKQIDLDEAKEKLIGSKEISREKCDSCMMELLQEEIGGNAEKYYEYEDGINKVKLEDVRKLARLKKYSFVALIPKN